MKVRTRNAKRSLFDDWRFVAAIGVCALMSAGLFLVAFEAP